MKLLTYAIEKKEKVGVITPEGGVCSIESAGLSYATMLELIDHGTKREFALLKEIAQKGGRESIPYDKIEKRAPIPFPRQDVICLGINYMDHAAESAKFKKEDFGGERPFAVYFSKRVNKAVADEETIDGHLDIVNDLDYEAELAVIIGKDARNVSKEKAFDFVLGYTILNDVSARTLQTRHKQWYFGKGLDGFAPMGPWIVTADELEVPPRRSISSKVNGELRQNSTTDLLIFGVDHVIAELSQAMTLKAGTIIAMGTPAGVGMGFTPPRFLKKGDIVECIIDGIGTLTNPVG